MKLLFTNKAYFWPTHRPDKNKLGWLEYQSKKSHKELWPVHRLDKHTTGCLALAEDKETAIKAEELFSQQKVEKEYYFITDRSVEFKEKIVELYLDDGQVDPSKNPNSSSLFELAASSSPYFLWKAKPKTGKTHQIRIHASHIGIPILGDELYEGSSYPCLFLHCHKMKIDSYSFEAPLPYLYKNLSILKKEKIASVLHWMESRKHLFHDKTTAYCLLQKEVGELRAELLNDHLAYQVFDENFWKKEELLELHSEIENLLEQKLEYHIQWMKNRGTDPNKKYYDSSENAKQIWQVKENDILFQVKANQGSSFGVFLDQKDNRKYISQRCKDKSVLNLFCYTGGFSLYAQKAGAKEIVNVDTSRTTLDWVKENIHLNNMDESIHEFWSTDARVFLKGCKNKKRKFDIIICDPPSFARGKKDRFQIQKDLPELVQSCLDVLKPEGSLLFSTNYEKWSSKDFQKICSCVLPKKANTEWIRSSYDFESVNQESILKGFIYHPSNQ